MRNLNRSLSVALSEVIILSILKEKSSYGYELASTIKKLTNGSVNRFTGNMYPHLNRLEEKGWINSDWEMKNERPKRVYTICEAGKAELLQQRQEWKLMEEIINSLK